MSGAPAVRYRTLGQYDAAFEVTVAPDGALRVEGGSYVTRGVRTGALSPGDRRRLAGLVAAVQAPADHPVPALAEGFTAELWIGDARVRWWGLPPTAPLVALVRFLGTRPL